MASELCKHDFFIFQFKHENQHVQNTPAWMGNKPLGAEYMPDVNEHARLMKAAVAIREQGYPTDNRQLRLPGFGKD